jgi:hypothetical protein
LGRLILTLCFLWYTGNGLGIELVLLFGDQIEPMALARIDESQDQKGLGRNSARGYCRILKAQRDVSEIERNITDLSNQWRNEAVMESGIVPLRNQRQLCPIAEQAVRGAADGSGAFKRAQRRIDLRPAGTEQESELALGELEVERYPSSGRSPSISKCGQQKSCQTDIHRVKCNGLEFVAYIPQAPAQEQDDGIRDGGVRGSKPMKIVSFEGVDGGSRQRGCFGTSRPAVQYRDFAEKIAGACDFEAQFPPLEGGNCQPNLPFQHQKQTRSRIAAREQYFALRELGFPKAGGASGEVVHRKSSEQFGARQGLDDTLVCVVRCHVIPRRGHPDGVAPDAPKSAPLLTESARSL